ncbi:ABC transporter substrate-binding protein [Propionivibrio soli]|uniref:ABC transporter substrate-binding protein n=1 Tax=Propionivibrio soli TaxID=2976531 RepID=UPI0021E85D37|nr:ABC transporter substrate-binding protein [Propionivibrio soli]
MTQVYAVDLFAPGGKLRAAINLGNAVLARRSFPDKPPYGVTIDMATEFAQRLGVGLELVAVDTAQQSVEAIAEGLADIGFFAIDPKRGEQIAFTEPYLLIEGSYLVREASPVRTNEDVDRHGRRVVVGRGSAYDLFLSRSLKEAELVRAPNTQAVVDLFMEQQIDVAASVKQQLEADMRRYPDLRLLPGHFMIIRQAMGVARARGEETAAQLTGFVEELKANGFIAQSLARHGVEGATVVGPST